jgi:hypothetical protein
VTPAPAPAGMQGGLSLERLLALMLWPLAAVVAAGFALVWIPAVFLDGLVVPSGLDAFYHARRILDAIEAPLGVVQFDARIHAPEGSWVPWPWGFDAALALVARVLRDGAGIEPIRSLVFVPPAFLLVNAALLVGVCRQLRLPPAAQWLAGLCFAISPLTQNLHAVGQIDHHFVEYGFVLATLWAGLRSQAETGRAAPAALLGAVLGLANAVHNGLFLLQLPVLAAVGLLWLRGVPLGARASVALAGTLLGTTVLVALPADAFRLGFGDYELLSWFHVHVAALTALTLCALARERPTRAAIARIALIALLGAAPLLRHVVGGLSWLTGDLYRGWEASEMRAPFAGLLEPGGAIGTLRLYGGLIFLLPFSLLAALVAVVRSPDRRLVFACVYALFGGALLLQQYRLHHFGSFALYVLPLALMAARAAPLRAPALAWSLLAVLVVAAHAPPMPGMLRAPPPGGYRDFMVTRPLYPALAEACARQPGVVLAHTIDGHYVRYFSDCAVIANVLVLSGHSFGKLRESVRLFGLDPAALPREAPWVRYVLVRREDNFTEPGTPQQVLERNSPLRQHLLFTDAWPAEYRLLGEVRQEPAGWDAVVARLFEVTPAGAAP